jgi:hypothetical protein
MHRRIYFGSVVVFSVEVLGIFGGITRLLPSVSVRSCLDFGDEGGAGGGHLPIGVGVVIVKEELNVLRRDVSSRLIVG